MGIPVRGKTKRSAPMKIHKGEAQLRGTTLFHLHLAMPASQAKLASRYNGRTQRSLLLYISVRFSGTASTALPRASHHPAALL